MKRTVRTMVGSLFFVVVPLVVCGILATALLLVPAPEEYHRELWWNVERLQQIVVCTLGFVAGLVFCWLQLAANHPWASRDLGDWLCRAGWDGRRRIRHLAIHLEPLECFCVAGMVLVETVLAGGLSVSALFGWALGRVSLLSCKPQITDRRCLVVWMATVSGLALLAVSVPLAAGMMIAVIWLLERVHREALVEWAEQSVTMSVDLPLTPDGMPDEVADEVAQLMRRPFVSVLTGRLDPRVAQVSEFVDSRPEVRTALWISGLIAFLPTLLVWSVASLFVPDEQRLKFSEMGLVATALISGFAMVFLLALRCFWYALGTWYPARGVRRRLAERRIFDWAFDCCLLALPAAMLPVFLLPVQLLVMGEWNPWLVSAAAASTLFLLQRLGPDPVRWQLTSPARMIRMSSTPANRSGKPRRRRRAQRT